MKFEVTYTNFDTIAKEEWVSVYISRAAVPESHYLPDSSIEKR
jgi:hypothetical protein